jgi:hypothetical protein
MSAEMKLLRVDNYPNLHRFTSDVAKLTGDFTKEVNCDRLPQLYPPKPWLETLWHWSRKQFHQLVW